MPIDPVSAVAAAGTIFDIGKGIIGDVIDVLDKVSSKALSEEEGRKLLTAARSHLRAADQTLEGALADNDRFIDGLPPLPEPTTAPTPPIVAPQPAPAAAAPGPQPTGEQ